MYIYIYTGGEPMVRKDDLIALCNKHNDCVFLCFTNATPDRRGVCRQHAPGQELYPGHLSGGL